MTTRRDNLEGTYSPRPGGRWQFRVSIDGRRYSGSGRTRREAREAALAAAKQSVPKTGTSPTWGELVESWATESATVTGLRPSTRDQYLSLLRNHVVPTIGKTRIGKATKRALVEVLSEIPGSSARRSSYAALVKVGEYAVERGYLGRNVVRDVKRPKSPEHKPREASREQIRDLIQAARGHRWEVGAWVVAMTGLRRGELLGLRWSDVDFDGGVINVSGSLSRSSAGLVRGAPKTKRGYRSVPMPPALAAVLREHRARQRAEQSAAVFWQWSGMVLTNEVGGPVEPRNFSRAWSKWASAAGLDDRGIHLGRHFVATELLRSGRASVPDVAAQMGHDPAMLLGTYAAAVAEGQRAAADFLAEAVVTPVSVD